MEVVAVKESYEEKGKRTSIPSWKDDSPWVKHDDRNRNMDCVVCCQLLSKLDMTKEIKSVTQTDSSDESRLHHFMNSCTVWIL